MELFHPGDHYAHTFLISREVYVGFGNIFQDRNPLHTDEEFAKAKGFPGFVMYGNILNGFLSFFIGECLPTKDVIIHTQEIQYKKAVFLDDSLELDAEITDTFDSVNVVQFKYRFSRSGEVVAKGKFQIGILV